MMRIYYGWFIIAIGLLVFTLTIGSVFTSFGLFVLPVSEEFKLSRANTNTAMIVVNFGMALAGPFVGRMLDHYPARRIMAFSSIMLGMSLVALGLSYNLWLSAAILALPLATSTLGAGVLTAKTLAARWFTVQRGRAMAILAIGMSMGGIIVVPLVGLLIESMGWRPTLVIMGCCLTAILLMLVPFVRDRPGPDDVESNGAEGAADAKLANGADESATPLKAPQLLRMSQFWSITMSTAITLGVLQAFTITVVPLAQEDGISTAQAAGLMSVVAATAIMGKLVLAWISDRLDRALLLASMFGVLGLANAALLFGDSYFLLAACCALVGLCAGVVAPTYYALMADRFGAASFGTATGLGMPALTIMGAICVRYSGEVFDRTGSYDLMFITFIGVQLVAAALMLANRFWQPAAASHAHADIKQVGKAHI